MATNIGDKTYLEHTAQDIDDAIDAIAGMLGKADIYKGTKIEASTDVNSLTDYGTYYCADGTTAASLSNCPISSTGFIMVNFSTGNRIRLFLAASATNPRIFVQARTSSTWQTIKTVAFTDDIQAAKTDLLKTTTIERITLRESAGGTTESSTTRIGSEDYFEIPTGASTLTFEAFSRSYNLQSFVCFYNSSKTYLGNTEWTGYVNWKDPGKPAPIPSSAKYVRVCFRYSDNATINVSDMIKCILSFD